MSDTATRTHEDILGQAEANYQAATAEIERLEAELNAEPLASTPALDRIGREEEKIAAEEARLAAARHERDRQIAALDRQREKAREALDQVREAVAEARRREQWEAEQRLAYERAKEAYRERQAERRLQELGADTGPPSHSKVAAKRVSRVLGLPVGEGHLHHKGTLAGQSLFTFSYHVFFGYVRVDVDGAEIFPGPPNTGVSQSDDPADYINWEKMKELSAKYETPEPEPEAAE